MTNKLKFILLLSLFIIFFKDQSISQFSDRFGVNLILSASNQNVKGYDIKTSNLYGMGIGVFYEFYKTRMITTCINLDYVQRGTEANFELTHIPEEESITIQKYSWIDYLSLPIITKILFYKSEISPQFLFGLRIDYTISYDTHYFEILLENANNFVFGGVLGVGCEFELNEYIILIPSLRLNFDFNNAININNEVKFRNKSIDFSLGVKIK